MRNPRAYGFTLVELVVAAGLLTLLLVTLFNMIDGFLSLWEKSELRRQLVEEAASVTELIAADLSALDPGPRGDLLCEWVLYDTDGNGVAESKWPRLRFVRHASPREIALGQAQREVKERGEGLIEVFWAVLPAHSQAADPDLRAEGFLWRGERLYKSAEGLSFFDPRFLSVSGKPTAGAAEEVTGGVLWLGFEFATQTSVLTQTPVSPGGWRLGTGMEDCSASWDAWKRGRPNADAHFWNEFGEGLVRVAGRPLLPRRVKIVLELEREKDLLRRTRLVRACELEDTTLAIDDEMRVPGEGGAFVRVGAEWMEVVSRHPRALAVKRGARGTTPSLHAPGELVHYGARLVREVPIRLSQEDWDL